MILLLLILLISSCSKSEVVLTPPLTKSIDTCYTPRQRDTTRKEIRFNVSIIEWKETEL